ncbi:MAG: hypothetical protein QXR96_03350 [Candidatus Woesearchaeota archaeon]
MRYIKPNERLEAIIREAEKYKPIAEGSSLVVFPHPLNNELVIKKYRWQVTIADFSSIGISFYQHTENLNEKFQFLNFLISTYPSLINFIDIPYFIVILEETYYTVNKRGIPLNQIYTNNIILNLLQKCKKAFEDAGVIFPEEDENLSCYLYLPLRNIVVRTDIHSNKIPYCGTRIL